MSNSQIKAIRKPKISWHYLLSPNFDILHNCSCSSGCDEYVCRCATIVDPHIERISPYQAINLVKSFLVLNNEKNEPLAKSLANRFFSAVFRNPDDLFDIEIVNGYYGDEIHDVKFNDKGWHEYSKKVAIYNNLSNKERVEYVLELEYGKILPEVKTVKAWDIVLLPLDMIDAPQHLLDQMKSIQTNCLVTSYIELTPWANFGVKNSFDFPAIIAISNISGKSRLIDGLHRYKAWTTRPHYITEKSWKRMRKNKKMPVLIPLV